MFWECLHEDSRIFQNFGSNIKGTFLCEIKVGTYNSMIIINVYYAYPNNFSYKGNICTISMYLSKYLVNSIFMVIQILHSLSENARKIGMVVAFLIADLW